MKAEQGWAEGIYEALRNASYSNEEIQYLKHVDGKEVISLVIEMAEKK